MKNVIVTLRIFKGREAYDSSGKLISENQTMKLTYGILEWKNFLKTVINMGLTKVEIVKCTDGDNGYKEIEIPKEIQADIDNCFKIPESLLTPEQKKIKELEEKIEALAGTVHPKGERPKKEKVIEEVIVSEDNSDIEQLRIKYEELWGEKPHQRMGIKKMNQKIAEKSV